MYIASSLNWNCDMLTSLHRWRALLTLCVALAWGLGVLARTPRQGTNEYFNTDTWSLVASDNNTITSLSDLKDGVYSIQLSGVRSGCGLDSKGPGMIMMFMWTHDTKYSFQWWFKYINITHTHTWCRVSRIQQQDLLHQDIPKRNCWSSDARTQQINDVARVDDPRCGWGWWREFKWRQRCV